MSIRFAGLIILISAACFGASRVDAQTFSHPKSDGCADIFLYGWNEGHSEVIVVRADREVLGLDVGTTTLSLAAARKGLEVKVDVYAKPLRGVDYCTDVRRPDQPDPIATLRAETGHVTITLGKRGAVKGTLLPSMYEAVVTLQDLTFRRPDGSVVSTKEPITLKGVVGYYWG